MNSATQEPWVKRQCAFRWQIELMTENLKVTNSVGAAVESFRNEMKQDNSQLITQVSQSILEYIDGS